MLNDIITLCSQLPEQSSPPEWIDLVPAGASFTGTNGATFTKSAELLNSFKNPIPVDIAHSTQLKASKGEEAPAVGWIKELKDDGGVIKGRVDWTEQGKDLLNSKSYKYISPAFRQNRTTGEVVSIISAGLTNSPNLDQLAALNSVDAAKTESSPTTGALATTPPDKATKATEGNGDFVPKADFEALQKSFKELEQKLSQQGQTAHQEKVDIAINSAIQQGKITPANKALYQKVCNSAEGLAEFETFIASAPQVIPNSELVALNSIPQSTVSPQQKEVFEMLGVGQNPQPKDN